MFGFEMADAFLLHFFVFCFLLCKATVPIRQCSKDFSVGPAHSKAQQTLGSVQAALLQEKDSREGVVGGPGSPASCRTQVTPQLPAAGPGDPCFAFSRRVGMGGQSRSWLPLGNHPAYPSQPPSPARILTEVHAASPKIL